MVDRLLSSLSHYFSDLTHLLQFQWNHMTPNKYISLLVTVGVIGWIMMKNGVRQH